MDVGVYGVKLLKANTLQPLPERSRLEVGTLWDGECFSGILWIYLLLWTARWINTSTHLTLCGRYSPLCVHCFPQNDGVYQQENAKCNTTGSICSPKSIRMSLLFSPENQTQLT
ncbi:hypothetical protein TNIN_500741 [Trichonephila inaurata madagascariensis]|uniref:Uncharacterized protein n=1 Tax=Trichonephila inaurata madagascariensis TaxID=2747483 RepID=A0A8X7C6S8_9ARAC|nr:hypothetical protein TNIN_500741 [Trichonephila inaurata madagascariensis]